MRIFWLALLLIVPQDDKIQELIQRLDSDSIDVREEAQAELVKIGPAAIPHLKKAIEGAKDRPDMKVRAEEALKQIELNEKVKGVYREPRRTSLDVNDRPLKEVLEMLSSALGLKFDATAVDAEQKVTLKATDAALFEILDRLCAGREELTYEHRDEGVVRLLKEKHATCPAAYAGPFRFRVLELAVTRKTTFKEKSATLTIAIEPDHEKHLKPQRTVRIEITKIVDDKGRELRVENKADDPNAIFAGGGRIVIRGGAFAFGGNAEGPEHLFTAKGLSHDAKSIATVKGVVHYRFPLDSRDITFDKDVQKGDTRKSGDYTFKIEKMSAKNGTFEISFTRAKGKGGGEIGEDIANRLDTDSLVAVDSDGAEHKAKSFMIGNSSGQMVIVQNGAEEVPQAVTYMASVPSVRGKTIQSIKFRFIDRTFDKSVPFEISGIELP